MQIKTVGARVDLYIKVQYDGKDLDLDALKKDVVDNVNHFIENGGLRMSEYTKTPPKGCEVSGVFVSAYAQKVWQKSKPDDRLVYVNRVEGALVVETPKGEHICDIVIFEDGCFDVAREKGFVGIGERFPNASYRVGDNVPMYVPFVE